MEADLLCFGFFCSDEIPPDKRKKFIVKDYSHLDKRICEYIESAFECAPRNHFDIFVNEYDDRVTVSVYIAPSVLFGKSKDALANLILNADDCFIFKDTHRLTFLELRLCLEKNKKILTHE